MKKQEVKTKEVTIKGNEVITKVYLPRAGKFVLLRGRKLPFSLYKKTHYVVSFRFSIN